MEGWISMVAFACLFGFTSTVLILWLGYKSGKRKEAITGKENEADKRHKGVGKR